MAKHPIFSMTVALAEGGPDPTGEVPLDVFIHDFRGNAYLALRAGESTLLLTEPEARALAVAVRKVSVLASALDNARDHIGKGPRQRERQEM